MTLAETAASFRSGLASARQIAERSLSQIRDLNPTFNAFLTITEDHALAQADCADNDWSHGVDHGPLHGCPIALKDVFATAGIRTTCGSLLFENHIPAHNSAVAQRLAKAGTVLTGKTGLHELAYGITSNNPAFWGDPESPCA